MVHLMSAGRIRYLRPARKGPKTPAFRLRFVDGGELVLTEAGAKKRAGVWLLRAGCARGRDRAPRARGGRARRRRRSRAILASDSRRLHSLLRDQRLIAGIGRAWANEILHAARLSPVRALDAARRGGGRAARGGDPRRARARPRAPRARAPNDTKTYRVHNRLGEPCHALRDADRAGRLRGAHDLLLPRRARPGARPQGPPPLPAAQVRASAAPPSSRSRRRYLPAAAPTPAIATRTSRCWRRSLRTRARPSTGRRT